jgi:FAD/FMN-containing dehydrogenase
VTALLPDIDQLRANVSGSVLTESDGEYEQARRVWNGATDRRPSVIVRCTTPQDVVAALAFAREQKLDIAVRGGGHSTSGAGVLDDGLVIDLSPMNAVHIDPETRRARVGGGALLANLDAAAAEHGLGIPAGHISHTGVGGLTLGGGMGWLTRQFGLTIDNMLSAEVVLADGRIVRASADEEPELFWALRGAGANFGVVTEFEFQLHPVSPLVHMGLYFWPLEQGKQALTRLNELVPKLPREIGVIFGALNAPPAPFVPPEHHFQPGYVAVLVSFVGDEARAAAAEQLTADLPPLFDMVTPIPYVAVQQMLDEGNRHGLYAWEKGVNFAELSPAAIDAITAQIEQKRSPMTILLFYRLDGAYAEVDPDATAFGGPRVPHFAAFIVGISPDAEGLPAEREWVRETWRALQPYALAGGAYVNGISDYEEFRARAVYGDKYERLARIKARYDPANVFNRTANINPAPVS